MGKKRALVFGYFEKNLGDDLMLELFLQRGNYAKSYIFARKANKKFYRAMGARVICYDGFFYRVINKLTRSLTKINAFYLLARRNTDFVMLGGSLFAEQEQSATQQQLRNLSYAVKHADAAYVIGSNFGPYHSPDFLEQYKALFAHCRDVCFRDEMSWEFFRHLPTARFAPDVVFSGEWSSADQMPADDENAYVLVSLIDISIRPTLREHAARYEKFIFDVCYGHLAKGDKVILLSMCDKEGDSNICQRIFMGIDSLYRPLISVQNYNNIPQMLRLFRAAKAVYATRFHAMILGAYFAKHTIAVAYNEKVIQAVYTYGLDVVLLQMDDLRFTTEMLNSRAPASVEIQKLQRDAAEQWNMLGS
ncbi:MAG: polysaccharide pyruvyl transferase family protein [Clostridia bacterium]|nr:polysaccharide pyruvyl transferase family protein [Clostridia bacterium]